MFNADGADDNGAQDADSAQGANYDIINRSRNRVTESLREIID